MSVPVTPDLRYCVIRTLADLRAAIAGWPDDTDLADGDTEGLCLLAWPGEPETDLHAAVPPWLCITPVSPDELAPCAPADLALAIGPGYLEDADV